MKERIQGLSRTSKAVLGLNFLLITVFILSMTSAAENSDIVGENLENTSEVTFVSSQGGSAALYPHAGSLEAVHTPSKKVIWRHDKYRRYMDVDPLNNSTILFVAGNKTDQGVQRKGVVYDWREGKMLSSFVVTHDVHDIDKYSENSFVIAGKKEGKIYIYNKSSDQITWEYNFDDHFPRSAGGPCCGHEYTHLNDVEVVYNGSAFLASPRNFDRVFLINKTDKSVMWGLGEEDNYSILYEQHNPDVLSIDPPTVIVSDSENDRVIEYSRSNGTWEAAWQYSGDLNWPRDADRLRNGNTLITDTVNGRVIEVTPSGEVVWSYGTDRGPYEAERLPGDESVRKPIDGDYETYSSQNPVSSTFGDLYSKIGVWILPSSAGKFSFAVLLALFFVNISYLSKKVWNKAAIPSIYESSSRNSK